MRRGETAKPLFLKGKENSVCFPLGRRRIKELPVLRGMGSQVLKDAAVFTAAYVQLVKRPKECDGKVGKAAPPQDRGCSPGSWA